MESSGTVDEAGVIGRGTSRFMAGSAQLHMESVVSNKAMSFVFKGLIG